MIILELVAKEVIFGLDDPDKPSIGNVLAYKLLMQSEQAELLKQLVENADPGALCDLLMKSMRDK